MYSVRPHGWLVQFSLSGPGDEAADRAQPRARSPFMVEVLSFPEEELGLLTRNAP